MTSTLAKTYQRKTDKEHVLDNPDTYIGSVELVQNKDWIINGDASKIHPTVHNYIPGL